MFSISRFVCWCDSALWGPFATGFQWHHLELCREQQSHHHSGERERPILRVQPERRSAGQQGPWCAKCRDAQEGTAAKSSKITEMCYLRFLILIVPPTGCECIILYTGFCFHTSVSSGYFWSWGFLQHFASTHHLSCGI